MFSLKDKIAIVTGAGSGIGAATAECFGQAGARVYVADLDEARGIAVVAAIQRSGGQARFVRTDVSDPASAKELIARVLGETQGRCDVLVNNAGIGHVGTILTTEPADLDRLWGVNLKGAYYLSRAVLPSMIERRSGSIVNIASAAALFALEDRFAYIVTKHAVVGLTKSIALDLARTGVRVNCICPGRTETPFVQARLAEYPDPEKYRELMSSSHPVRRMAQPSEIAAAALYLASDESAFVTGSSLAIDGGYSTGK
jgi:NAD(P)-dependent dehydrogenase (short-subunit alcohol dehydrogenase family)